MGVHLLDLVLQRFCPQRPGADDAQDDQRQPDAERPADAEMLGDITEQWLSPQIHLLLMVPLVIVGVALILGRRPGVLSKPELSDSSSHGESRSLGHITASFSAGVESVRDASLTERATLRRKIVLRS